MDGDNRQDMRAAQPTHSGTPGADVSSLPLRGGWRSRAAWIVLLTTVLVAAAAWYAIKRETTGRAQQHFDFRVETIEAAIRERLLDYEHMLRGGIGLFLSSTEITREEWQAYVDAVDIERHYPGVQGVGFSRRVLPAEKEAHIRQVRAEGFPDYTIRPEGERPEYTSIVFLEPFDWRNQRAFGYDMFSEPVRQEAMAKARDTGLATLSGKVILVQETDEDVQAGFLLYLPLYRKGVQQETPGQRREALEGYVYSPFRMNDFMRGILAERGGYVELRVFDGDEALEDALLYDSEAAAGHRAQRDRSHLFAHQCVLESHGHRWLVAFVSSRSFDESIGTWLAHTILALGLVIALLLFGVVLSLDRSRAQAVATADMAVNLERTNAELAEKVAERQRATEALRSANRDLEASRKAALNVMQDANMQRQRAEQALVQLERSEGDLRRRAEWAQGLQKAGQELAACRSVDEVQRLAAQVPVSFLGMRMSWVSVPDSDGRVRPIAFSGADAAAASRDSECDSCVFKTRIQKLVPDTIGNPPFPDCPKWAREHDVSCCATFPILVEAECVATLTVRCTEPGPEGSLMQASPLLQVFAVHVGEVWQRCLREEQLRTATRAAEAANKAKSDFLANMSHELRTPLNAIIGFSQVLQEGYFGELQPRYKEYVEDIIGSGRHLLDLITDILDLSKVEAGKLELDLSQVRIGELIENSMSLIREKALKHGIQTEVNIGDDVTDLEIEADERKLKQIIFNLLSNAAKFTPDGGRIAVAAHRESDHLYISVTDTGIGISPKDQERIFEDFYQTKQSTRDKTPGTGLGLALVKRLVALQGGCVWVESKGEGKGSCFSFTVPLKQSHSGEAAELGAHEGGETHITDEHSIEEVLSGEISLARSANRRFSLCRLRVPAAETDAKLAHVREALRSNMRGPDRLMEHAEGHDCLILMRTDRAEAHKACDRLSEAVHDVLGMAICWTIVNYPEDGGTPSVLVEKLEKEEAEHE